MDETGIKFVVFYDHRKKVKGIELPLTKFVSWEDSIEEATLVISRKAVEFGASMYSFHVSSYDLNSQIPLKLKTYIFK